MKTNFFIILCLFSSVIAQNIPVENYQLVWSDEFEDDTLNLEKWSHRSLGARRDAINIKSAISIHENNYLIIRTEKVADKYFTGMLSTEGKFMTTYGYFEAKVYMPREKGLWAAFWLQSTTKGREIDNVADSGAEIDIFEYLGNRKKKVQHALHWNGYDRQYLQSRSKVLRNRTLKKGWHTFGLLWTENEYVFYVNGLETWRTSEAISKRSQYIILSVEIGDWAGKIKKADLPVDFVVDYVRVYKPIEN